LINRVLTRRSYVIVSAITGLVVTRNIEGIISLLVVLDLLLGILELFLKQTIRKLIKKEF